MYAAAKVAQKVSYSSSSLRGYGRPVPASSSIEYVLGRENLLTIWTFNSSLPFPIDVSLALSRERGATNCGASSKKIIELNKEVTELKGAEAILLVVLNSQPT